VGQFNLCVLASFLFVIWSAIFIWQSSFIALDGQRHFSLFDDAMISMRYAWNFAHGLGLVWNAGEYVEGYSNLLMTLMMSAASLLLDKEAAVLTIQLLGIPTGLGIAFLTRQISRMLFPANTHLADLAFISILFYAPTWYWSLLGMESALLTLLLLASVFCALRWLKNRRSRELTLTAVFLGLAFLTRNESLLLAGLVFGYIVYRLWRRNAQKADFLTLFYACLLYTLFVIAQLGFRYWYYGSLVPNTYVLKVMGMPLSVKLAWGWKYIWVFLSQTWPLLCVALAGSVMHRSRDVIALAVPFLVLLVYQVSVGGDAFRVWRILLPGMPFIFILAVLTITDLSARFARQVRWLPFLLTLVLFVITGIPLWTFIYDEAGLMRQTIANQHNVNVALGINAVTSEDASIGVIWAGAIPYYADRRAIDFLGKCDSYIASLPADLKMSVIGHNKYDLQYSIRKREPTYIQNFEWANENLKPWVVKHYIRANYATPYGDITLILKRNDPTVNWGIMTLIPWPEDEQ
jgi:hypothetical protein